MKFTTSVYLTLAGMAAVCFTNCVTQELSSALEYVTEANNNFTEDIYQQVVKVKGPNNFVISPFSLASSMAMIRAGASGVTADELSKGLRFNNVNESLVYDGYSELIMQLQETNDVIIETGNKVYTSDDFEIKDSYLTLLQDSFYADAEQVDFNKKKEAAETINNYVLNATNGKIENIISPDILKDGTKMVLVNAIYFKGLWKYPFDPEGTSTESFSTLEGEHVDVEMMASLSEFEYETIPELKSAAISIPYKGDRFSMIVILPNEGVNLTEVEPLLTDSMLTTIPSLLNTTQVLLLLPKFKFETEIDYVSNEILQNLGMKRFVTENAEFDEISDRVGLFVGAVVQKAFIEVNEEGTEAAASTSVVFGTRSASDILEFQVNRPFIAYIYDAETSSVLFVVRKVR